MSAGTIERPGTVDELGTRPAPKVQDPGDHDLFSHFVPRRVLDDAILYGLPVTALCGKTWVPTKDPKAHPVCPECKAAWEGKEPGDDERDDDTHPDLEPPC